MAACIAIAVLGLTQAPASAHDTGVAWTGYYVEYVGGSTLYRCAYGMNQLWDGGLSTNYSGAGTRSKSSAFCVDLYSVASGNLSTWPVLYVWNSGSPSVCVTGSQNWNSTTAFEVTSLFSFTNGPCGSVKSYTTNSAHLVYILGTSHGTFLQSGGHSF